jgi:hypothetical protein
MSVTMRIFLPRILLVAVALAVSVPAYAAPAEDANAAQARLHYQKAASLYELGRYAEAIPEYEAAFQLKNDPAFLYNLAQCHRLAGNLEQALHFYRRYLVKDPKETKAALRADSESRIAQLEKLIAEKNSVKTTPPNEVTAPGGTEPPPNTTATTPGTTTPGTTTPPGTTTSPPAETTPPGTMTPPAPTLITTPPPAAPANPRAKTFQKAGVIGIAAGGGLMVVGLALGVRASTAANDVVTASKSGQAFDPDVESRGKSFQKAEAVFMVLGALVAGAGAACYLYGKKLDREVAVTPVASANGAGALLQVTF